MAETNPTEPTFEINQIYVKDLSFEAPNSPRIFTREYKLKYDHDFEVVQLPLDATNGIFESQLKWTVTANTEDGDVAYVTECHQAGIFTLKGYDDETLTEMVKKACPQVLFPYLREAIGQMIVKGGFPAFYLPAVSIAQMYEDNLVISDSESGATS